MVEVNGVVRWKPGRRADKRRRRFPPEILTDAEVRSLMTACGGYRPTAVRNRALIALLYRGGLRISEALHVYPKDLDLEHGAVRVLFAKGGKYRTVGLDPGAVTVLQQWLDARSRWQLNGIHPVFCSQSGVALTSGYVRQLLPRLGREAGLFKRVHAHGVRHTHAAQLREERVDIGIISKQLGHTSIATTARNLDRIAPIAVVADIRSRCWQSVAVDVNHSAEGCV